MARFMKHFFAILITCSHTYQNAAAGPFKECMLKTGATVFSGIHRVSGALAERCAEAHQKIQDEPMPKHLDRLMEMHKEHVRTNGHSLPPKCRDLYFHPFSCNAQPPKPLLYLSKPDLLWSFVIGSMGGSVAATSCFNNGYYVGGVSAFGMTVLACTGALASQRYGVYKALKQYREIAAQGLDVLEEVSNNEVASRIVSAQDTFNTLSFPVEEYNNLEKLHKKMRVVLSSEHWISSEYAEKDVFSKIGIVQTILHNAMQHRIYLSDMQKADNIALKRRYLSMESPKRKQNTRLEYLIKSFREEEEKLLARVDYGYDDSDKKSS